MDNRIRNALDCITAEDELRTQTARAVAEALRKKTKTRSVMRYASALTACLVMLLMLGGFHLYMTPVATISVDINPSMELSVNRFDRVIDAEAFNEDAQKILSCVSINNMRYTDALELLLQSDLLDPYLENEADISITVLGQTEEHSSEMLRRVSTGGYPQSANVYCHSGSHQNVEHAHAANLSLGKYEAYLILHELDNSITPADVQGLTMRQIRLWIERLGGTLDDATHGSNHGHGSGTGNSTGSGNGHNNGHHGNKH